MTNAKTIEYFFCAHSAYAYLGAWELARIAQAAGASVIHRPFDFLPVIAAAGGPGFKERSAAHINYFFGRELVRWAEFRDLPILRYRPTYHDSPLELANGMIIAAGHDADALGRAILQAHWRDDADISDRAVLRDIGEAVGLNGSALLAAAQSPAVQDQHRANTSEAIARTVFGSPTYIVDGDMFYGQDHLPLVERALRKPFGD